MRLLLAVTALAACHGGRPRAPIAAVCAPDRIGAVHVVGAPRAALAPLTVLEGTLDDPERTVRITSAASESLRAQGYAKAALAVSRNEGCGVELTATVVLGTKYTIRSITFDTDDDLPQAQRLAVIEDGLGTVNTVGGTYIPYRLKRGLAQLKRRYADAGWVNAVIDRVHVDYDDRGHIALTIPVRAGARYTLGTIRAIGAGASARAAVLEALGLVEGSFYDRSAVRAGVERAQRALERKIQLRVSIQPERQEIDVDAIVEAP